MLLYVRPCSELCIIYFPTCCLYQTEPQGAPVWEGDAMSPVCRPPVRPVSREVVGRSSNVAKAARGAGYSGAVWADITSSQSEARIHLLSKAARQNLP